MGEDAMSWADCFFPIATYCSTVTLSKCPSRPPLGYQWMLKISWFFSPHSSWEKKRWKKKHRGFSMKMFQQLFEWRSFLVSKCLSCVIRWYFNIRWCVANTPTRTPWNSGKFTSLMHGLWFTTCYSWVLHIHVVSPYCKDEDQPAVLVGWNSPDI